MNNALARLLNYAPPNGETYLAPPIHPGMLDSIGRGMMDMVDPMTIAYHNLVDDPATADEYRRGKVRDAAIYRRGSDDVGMAGMDPGRALGRGVISGALGGLPGLYFGGLRGVSGDAAQAAGRALYDKLYPEQNALAKYLDAYGP